MSLGNTLKQREAFVPPKLQITSMMDMFTIIVFFLLFSFGERPDEIDVDKNLNLPGSTAIVNYENTIKLFVSGDHLKIEDQVVATIKNGLIVDFNYRDLERTVVFDTLQKIRKDKIASLNTLAEGDTGTEPNAENTDSDKPQMLFFCDKSIPFKTIDALTKIAGMVGFPNIQFAVLQVT